MKRGILFLICLLSIVACSEEKFESNETGIVTQRDVAFNEVLSDISMLNQEFGCDINITKSGNRKLILQTADYIGGTVGEWLGAGAGVYLGGQTGSPWAAFFLGEVGKYLGNMAGSSVISEIARLACDCAGCELVAPVWTLPGYYDNIQYCPFDPSDGSAGSAHNFILYNLENNEKSYIEANGNILVDEMFLDALQYEEDIHIEGCVRDSAYINEIQKFCEDFYSMMRTSVKQNDSGDQICEYMYDFLRDNGFDEDYVEMLENLDEALLPCVYLDDEDAQAYEAEYNDIIESSDLDICEKECLKTGGSVYIHSTQYWY